MTSEDRAGRVPAPTVFAQIISGTLDAPVNCVVAVEPQAGDRARIDVRDLTAKPRRFRVVRAARRRLRSAIAARRPST